MKTPVKLRQLWGAVLAAAVVACALETGLAHADPPPKICQNDLSQDRQPNFQSDGGLKLGAVEITLEGALQLNTNLSVLDPDNIILPFEQNLSVSFENESAGNSATLGWLYVDDLRAAGYVDAAGNLTDTDNNKILDLHEDLYGINPTRYVGVTRRCNNVAIFPPTAGVLRTPELAAGSDCSVNFTSVNLANELGYPAYASSAGWMMGTTSPTNVTNTTFSDNGLYPHVPNLLEPTDPLNGKKGVGHLIFLHADDDTDTGTFEDFAPVADSDSKQDGIPDYDVNAYDAAGKKLPIPIDGVINLLDRKVNLGAIQGNREIVFYTVSYGNYGANHNPSPAVGATVFPCLHISPISGICDLHLKTSVNVFFSKSAWNLDLNPKPGFASKVGPAAAARNIGVANGGPCAATDGSCGWLDQVALDALLALDGIAMPSQVAYVPRPANNRMPHVLVGAPTTDPFRWILGFEDLPGGGDRDFNDTSFLVTKQNGGGVTSGLVSGDISPSIAEDFTITKVTFTRDDDAVRGPGQTPAWTGGSACDGPPVAAINYSVAVDCNVMGTLADGGTGWIPNPGVPGWVPVVFDDPTTKLSKTLDMLDLGFTGSQLCWKAEFKSPSDFCRPTIYNVDVGYQAIRSGDYSRASITPFVNARVSTSYETPGLAWGTQAGRPAPSVRVYDGKKDLSRRGHTYFRTAYEAENPDLQVVSNRWEAGAALVAPGFSPALRRIYTSDGGTGRLDVDDATVLAKDAALPLATSCAVMTKAGSLLFDLNQDTVCNAADQSFLVAWLRGYENVANGTLRAWPLSGIVSSTPSVDAPPLNPDWWTYATANEQDKYTNNFAVPLSTRRVYSYVGDTGGMLHAFDSGLWKKDEECPGTDKSSIRGHFAHATECNSQVRDYGTGQEVFAYLPRAMLGSYVYNYVAYLQANVSGGPTTDVSPTVADVDFGGLAQAWKESALPTVGAKTVVVSSGSSGKYKDNNVVYALDVTHPETGSYPIPLWELDLDSAVTGSDFNKSPDFVPLPDNRGTRHSVAIGRVKFPAPLGVKWVAVVATDLHPNPGSAGALYFIDMQTGKLLTAGSPAKPLVVSFETNWGLSATPVLMDVDHDGTYDTIYVGTVSGNVYRVSPPRLDTSKAAGRMIPTCQVASAQLGLTGPPWNVTNANATKQFLYSNVAAISDKDSPLPRVHLYFATSDDPDEPDVSKDPQAANYYVIKADDSNPLSDPKIACPATPPALVSAFMMAGQGSNPSQATQVAWGGVSVDKDNVNVATAVGSAAEICNLSDTDSGRYYALGLSSLSRVIDIATGSQNVSRAVVYDGHLVMNTAAGAGVEVGATGKGAYNTGLPPPLQRTRVLMQNSGSRLPLPTP